MAKRIKLPGRAESAEVGGVVAGANTIYDDVKGKMQDVVNSDVDAELVRLEESKQDNLTFDNAPTEGSQNPVTSAGVYTADKALSDAIEAILLLIPSAASALNQLADKKFVQDSVATSTATFRGTYNVVSDLHLSANASHAQIEAALDALSLGADTNDYCFVQVPDNESTENIKKTERYKFNGTNWVYEYDLNNSGFTAAQWEAINSNITALLVTKLSQLPTNEVLMALLAAKQNNLTFDDEPIAGSINPVTSGGIHTRNNEIVAMITALEAAKQDNLTFDSTPVNGSENPVMSGGVYNAIYLVQVALAGLDGRMLSAEHSIEVLTENVGILRTLYQALSQSDIIVGAKPTTGMANKVYRVPGTSTYADWMYYDGAWVKLAEYTTLDGYLYKGIATPNGSPAASAVKMFYFALTPGTYTNFGNLVVKYGINILKYDGANWTLENLGNSDGVFDVTEYSGSSFASLEALLSDENLSNLIPVGVRKGGMSIKFVQSSDNKYVQFRYMSSSTAVADFTNVANWQGVDDEPTAGSENMVKSGGVANITNGLLLNNITAPFTNFKQNIGYVTKDTNGKKSFSPNNSVRYISIPVEYIELSIEVTGFDYTPGTSSVSVYTKLIFFDSEDNVLSDSSTAFNGVLSLNKPSGAVSCFLSIPKDHVSSIKISNRKNDVFQLSQEVAKVELNQFIAEFSMFNIIKGYFVSYGQDNSKAVTAQNSLCYIKLPIDAIEVTVKVTGFTYTPSTDLATYTKLIFFDSNDIMISQTSTAVDGVMRLDKPVNAASCYLSIPTEHAEEIKISSSTNSEEIQHLKKDKLYGYYGCGVSFYPTEKGRVTFDGSNKKSIASGSNFRYINIPVADIQDVIEINGFTYIPDTGAINYTKLIFFDSEDNYLSEVTRLNSDNRFLINKPSNATQCYFTCPLRNIDELFIITYLSSPSGLNIYKDVRDNIVNIDFLGKVSIAESYEEVLDTYSAASYFTELFSFKKGRAYLVTINAGSAGEDQPILTKALYQTNPKQSFSYGIPFVADDNYVCGYQSGITERPFQWKVISYESVPTLDKRITDLEQNKTDIVSLNGPQETLLKFKQIKKPIYDDSGINTGIRQLSLLQFSDIHGIGDNLTRIADYYKAYQSYIDDVIHCGDVLPMYWGQDFSFWSDNETAQGFLNCIGNHDTAYYTVAEGFDWTRYVGSDAYQRYFAPFISGWGVTHDGNTSHCYYYKDYPTNKVRLIVTDCMSIVKTGDSDQLSWFAQAMADTLDSSNTVYGYHVVGVCHYGTIDTAIDCALQNIYKHNNPNYMALSLMDAVDDFIEDGGKFVCWIAGHSHRDCFGTYTGRNHQHKIATVVVDTAAAISQPKFSDISRDAGTKGYDLFNIFSVDTYRQRFSVFRVGADLDSMMHHIGTISYDYENQKLLASY